MIETKDPNQVRYIARVVSRENKLHAIRLSLTSPLSELKIEDDWRGIPLVIYSSEFGDFKKLIHQMNTLRQLNVVIFLSTEKVFNLTGLQILSSLHISCGLVMDKESNAWEETMDLMHYAIYGRTKHAQVEPFNYIATQYAPGDFLDYDTVYFDNPEKFLHLNESGQVALTSSNLSAGTFISDNLEILDLESNESYMAHVNRRYEVMLSMNDCAFCPSFRMKLWFSPTGALLWLMIIIILAVVASLLPARSAALVSVRESLAYQ